MTTPFKSGTEFLVNTTLAGTQNDPTITALADGRFVVAWTDSSATGGDTSSTSIRAQIFNADGTAFGTEFLVNTTVANNQDQPTIIDLADGRFVVAWRDLSLTGGDTSAYAIRAQIFSADGSAFGPEFLVNTTVSASQVEPTITALADGRFVVAWTDLSRSGGDTSDGAIRAQIFNVDGSTFGGEFMVNTTVSLGQDQPTITALTNGGFVVAWTDASQTGGDTSQLAVRAQVFNANGSTFGTELLVNTTTAGDQFEPTIAALADGRFVVVWRDESQAIGASSLDIRAQVFNADGSAFGAEFVLNTTPTGNQYKPAIAALADGRFVVVWTDDSQTGGDTNGDAIRAQVFNADGSTSGREFLVNTTVLTNQITPTVTALADGRFVVSWTHDSSGINDIRGQIFDPREAGVVLNGTLADDGYVGTIFGDVMRGSAGNDVLDGGRGDDVIAGEWDNDVITGGAGNDRLTGDDGDDDLRGNGGSDVLEGGAGNDSLHGGVGADFLLGGDGDDYYVIDSAADRVIDSAGAFDTLSSGTVNLDLSLASGIEIGILTGSANLWIFGSFLNDTLFGNSGDNYLFGDDGDDSLTGGAGNDELEGWHLNDTLQGGSGIDSVYGGGDDDDLILTDLEWAAGEIYDGGAGQDRLVLTVTSNTSIFDFTAISLTGIETITMQTVGAALRQVNLVLQADQMTGISRIDWLTGPGAPDSLSVVMGAATTLNLSGLILGNFSAAQDGVTITGDNDAETITAADARSNLIGGGGADVLTGGTANDTLGGGLQNDQLAGGLGNDVLFGGTGNDTLAGGAGQDSLSGNGGLDVFVFAAGSGADRVTDFADGQDKIDLSAYGFANATIARTFFADVAGALVFTNGADVLTINGMTKAQITFADLIL